MIAYNPKIQRSKIRHKTVRCLELAGLLVLILVLPAQAQNQPIDQARAAYRFADYDKALDLFAEIASDNAADKEVRKEALRHLSRLYVAKDRLEMARQVLTQLLTLEPPLIDLDPVMEPPPVMAIYYEVRKAYNVQHGGEDAAYIVPSDSPGLQTIAIMDFRNYALDDHERWRPMQWGLSSSMIDHLVGATDLKVVERENLQWLLEEQDMQRDLSSINRATAVQMGNMLGAHAMVFGGIYVSGRTMQLRARVVSVETGEILLSEREEGKHKEFSDLLEKLSLKIAKSLNSTLTKEEISARTETRSLDAMRAYAQGIAKLDQGDYQAASEKFQEAFTLDPNHIKAKRRFESIKIMLTAASFPGVDLSEDDETRKGL